MASSAVKPKVLLLGDFEIENARSTLESFSEVIEPQSSDRAALISELKAGKYSGIKTVVHTVTSTKTRGNVDGDFAKALGEAGINFLTHNGAGYDPINIKDCTAAGIRVSNTPGAVDVATADTTMFLILGALRGYNQGLVNLRKGGWKTNPAIPRARDPEGKILGIVGMGGIGKEVRNRAKAFGMKVIYYNRSRLPGDQEGGAEYVTLDDLLAKSDAISLNLPLNPGTHHMIGKAQFARMKDGVVIVNTARGAIMDEDALVQAIKSGKVASVGLDVFEEEPKIHPELLSNDKLMLLPHLGTHTLETAEKMELLVVDNVKQSLEQGKLVTPVPEQKDTA